MSACARALPALAALAAAGAIAGPTVSTLPAAPVSGQPVQVQLSGTEWPTYLPPTRLVRNGNTVVIDYEYASGQNPSRPDFGALPLGLGELAPGRYSLQARLIDMTGKTASPQVVTASFDVAPPAEYDITVVPKQPDIGSAVKAVINSAAYIDASSVRISQPSPGLVRVDFAFDLMAPVSRPAPRAGMVPFVVAELPALGAGSWRVEGWGTPTTGGNPDRFFTRDFSVAPTSPVVEYYAESLDHYFVTAWSDEVALLDSGAQPGWKRTAQAFKAWRSQSDAPLHARPVCRFYARGPNSHFYTGDAAECDSLKAIERDQRASAAARGEPFMGWAFEGIAFYALVPANGQCPAGSTPVYREYNNRASQNDTNHRFTPEPALRAAMAVGWIDEGVAFCSPQ